MTRTLLTLALIVSSWGSAWATRVLDQPETSFELSLAEVSVPEDATGAVSFKACALCRSATHPVTPETKYFIDGAEVRFEDFLVGVKGIARSARPSTFVGLFVDIESQRVNRIVVRQRKK